MPDLVLSYSADDPDGFTVRIEVVIPEQHVNRDVHELGEDLAPRATGLLMRARTLSTTDRDPLRPWDRGSADLRHRPAEVIEP